MTWPKSNTIFMAVVAGTVALVYGLNIDEKAVSSKKYTQFKTRVLKPGQNQYPIYDQNG